MIWFGMVWYGMGSAQTIFATSLLILTIMYVNTITGIESLESQILEMEGGAEKFYNYYNYIRNATCIINMRRDEKWFGEGDIYGTHLKS